MLPFKPCPDPPTPLPPTPHTDSRTHTYTHCSKGAFVPLFWRTRFPSRFISDWQIPWADDGVETFHLCLFFFLACAVQVYNSENNMQCFHCRIAMQFRCPPTPSHPPPSPSRILTCFPLLKNCIPIQHWSKAWLCSMMNAQFPVHKQNYGKWEAFPASKKQELQSRIWSFFLLKKQKTQVSGSFTAMRKG